VFESHVLEGQTVIDIGAHVGFYTLLAARLVGPAGHVIAFEPVPRNLCYLRRHLRMNDIDNVSIVGKAVGRHEGSVAFHESPDHSMGRIAADGALMLEAVAIDGFLAENEYFCPDCIKMDIEGGEYDALLGAKNTLAECKPILFLSTHDKSTHEKCCLLLKEFDYRLHSLDGERTDNCRELLATAR
jgi:FkbM family methyltransferase